MPKVNRRFLFNEHFVPSTDDGHTPADLPGGKTKILLDNVSGRFMPRELTGILGPSGAGKTTLLNAISGYRRSGVEGRISAGCRRSRRYISQEDLLPPLITAGELMEFASCLKLPASYTAKQRAVEVENVLSSLGLEDISDTRTERLSGGQKRRLVIALELISNPQILFLDEPTSGLDTVSCGQLIRLLSSLARGGKTIVCTIHQPSATLFDIFDQVYFLAAGKCIYQGGPGPHLLKFLEEQNLSCPVHHNPADFIIELTEEIKYVDILSKATDNGRNSFFIEEEKMAKDADKDLTPVDRSSTPASHKEQKQGCEQSFWLQFTAIFFRILLQAKRNKSDMRLQLLHHVGCSVLLGSMTFRIGNDGSDIIIHLKYCVGVVLFHAFTMQMVPTLYYPFEIKLLKKEHFNKWYGLLPYYMAFTAAKSPTMIPLNLCYSTIVYTLAGWPWEVERFALFSLVGLMTALVAESIGLTIGALFSATNGAAIGPMIVAPFLGLACYGFDFMNSMPPLMDFLTQASYMRTGLHSMMMILFGLDRSKLECNPDAEYCPYTNPKNILHEMNLNRFSIAQTLGHFAIFFVLFRLSFYLALKWKLRR